jgi:glyoxylase-like metal-dependent hydrolase (beta-lactamase superfamily II)
VAFSTFYPGEGHTRDNIVVWFPARRVLFGGCVVKSIEAGGLGNVNDANLESWPATIGKVMARYPNAKYVIPGHQRWSGRDALRHTLALLAKAGHS